MLNPSPKFNPNSRQFNTLARFVRPPHHKYKEPKPAPHRRFSSFTFSPPNLHYLKCPLYLGANLHYVFPVADRVAVYPLAGLGYAHATAHLSDLGEGWKNISDGKIAVNLGAGVDFKVASTVNLNLELKYQIVENVNQLIISAGVAFAF